MNGTIHGGRDVTKMHSARADAFQSPEFGPLGHVDEDYVFFARRPFRRLPAGMAAAIPGGFDRTPSGAAPSDLFLRTAIDAKVDGIVIDASRFSPRQLDLVTAALDRGITVVTCNPQPTG